MSDQEKAITMARTTKPLNLIEALPTILLMNIIALLPVSSISACRCVCKLFFRLISEKHFTKLCNDSPYKTIALNTDIGVHLMEVAKGYCKSYKSVFPRNVKIVGSCNGLLCLLVLLNNDKLVMNCWWERLLKVCNPVLGQYADLPRPHLETNFWMKDVYGFGVGSVEGPYKVLRISTRVEPPHPIYKKRSDAEILSIGIDDQWRSLGYLPYPSDQQEFLDAIMEGAFHWLFYHEDKHITSLHAFNIKEEQDYQILIPPRVQNCNVNVRVGVLRNYLCILDNSIPSQFNIWSMKEYGVGESWTLECTLQASIPGGLDAAASAFYPVAVLTDESILIKSQDGNLYAYNQKNSNFVKFEVDNVELLAKIKGHTVHSSNFCPADIFKTGCLKLEKSFNSPKLWPFDEADNRIWLEEYLEGWENLLARRLHSNSE